MNSTLPNPEDVPGEIALMRVQIQNLHKSLALAMRLISDLADETIAIWEEIDGEIPFEEPEQIH